MHSSTLLPAPNQLHYKEVRSRETIKGKVVNLCLLNSIDSVPDHSLVTSASIIPFMESSLMVATVLQRGLDIPGGHVEASDNGIVQTIKRETYEEACLSLADPLYLIGIIASDYDPKKTTYMLITTGRVDALDDFVAIHESVGREILSPDDFLARYEAGPRDMMQELLKRAYTLSSEFF